MARSAAYATLLTLTLVSATLHAQSGAVESNLPEAGFGPPPAASTPATSAAPSANPVTPAGEALPPGASAPTIRVFSRETIFDVLASDDKGNPVRGLTRSDFTILEDGKPQPIRGFSESETALPPPDVPLPPDTYTNAHTLPAHGPVQIFLIERAVVQSKETGEQTISVPPGLLDYFRTMPLGTQVAVFTFSPVTALQMVQGFTSDGYAAANAASRITPDVDLAPAFVGTTTTMQRIAALDEIAAYVAGIHGRKNLIWLYSGKPPVMVTRDGGYEYGLGPGGKVQAGHDMTIVHRLMDIYETFAREQIAIYPVNPNGIHGLGLNAMKSEEIADQTGGTFDNTNDKKAEITSIVDRSSDIYTLSIVPPRLNEDARFHSIKILVDRPNVHLTYRTGYDDDHPRPPDGMLKADLMQGPMRLGALPATQLIFTLKVTPAPPGEKEPQVKITDKNHAGSAKDQPYNAVFAFDPTQIALSETPGGKRTAKLEFDLGAFDSNSKLGPVRSQTITLSVSASGYDDFMRKPFEFKLPIPIPAGQQTLRAGLFDTVSGKSGTLQVPLIVPKR